MKLKSTIVAQFGRPTGLMGHLAGRIMANRPSNRLRNKRTVDLLHLEPDSNVLEIGCGPGLALSHCTEIVTSGRIVGLDHSGQMIRQARGHLRRQIDTSRVELVNSGIEWLVDRSQTFDRIFSLNVIQFQADKPLFFQTIARALKPGGRCLTTYQPRLETTGVASAESMGQVIEAELAAAGLSVIETVEIIGGDAPALCVIGQKP